ncbi:CaiB/BaiF CoA-transferase family protein [Blastomonas sp. UPD001]|uniref:CaiB/BaiF CoA transferase family protein n=1 Tax=Blastomonas sp. UPD001 TaxID=2217673 RepID=UPI001E377151|nr:CaiB/BaiF CoA-transferase family protein [Blastomonas sp. UPD001]
MNQPALLSGLRILAFTHYVQGPAAMQYLADMGADVIKVEPVGGAWERHRVAGRQYGGASATYIGCNRNVRSLALDLKSPAAKEIIHNIVANCDAVAENYRIGVLDRLGFGFDDLKAIKPDLIYASATGWGANGPMSGSAGQDLLAQARSGLIGTTGTYDRPTAVGTALVDQHAATLMALGILGAYVRKLRSGQGCRVESNLLMAGLDLQMESIGLWFAGEGDKKRLQRGPHVATWLHDAPYGVYKLADCHAVISLGPNAGKLVEALSPSPLDSLAADARRHDRDGFANIVAERVAPMRWEELKAWLEPHGLWCERVAADFDEVIDDPQVQACGAFELLETPEAKLPLLAHPIQYDGTRPALRHMAWQAGSDSENVLLEAGYSQADIERFAAGKIVGLPLESRSQS